MKQPELTKEQERLTLKDMALFLGEDLKEPENRAERRFLAKLDRKFNKTMKCKVKGKSNA